MRHPTANATLPGVFPDVSLAGMFYRFPPGSYARAVSVYKRPYENPLTVDGGMTVVPDRSRTTDLLGWTWCDAADGRGGWVPDAWFEDRGDVWVARRDYSALELSVTPEDRLELLIGESGFILSRNETGDTGWVPDAVLVISE